jgi:hypothetical protein
MSQSAVIETQDRQQIVPSDARPLAQACSDSRPYLQEIFSIIRSDCHIFLVLAIQLTLQAYRRSATRDQRRKGSEGYQGPLCNVRRYILYCETAKTETPKIGYCLCS